MLVGIGWVVIVRLRLQRVNWCDKLRLTIVRVYLFGNYKARRGVSDNHISKRLCRGRVRRNLVVSIRGRFHMAMYMHGVRVSSYSNLLSTLCNLLLLLLLAGTKLGKLRLLSALGKLFKSR